MRHIRNKALIIMSICAVFLFIKYIAQLFPSLIAESLMKKYALDGLQLGILASSYYYSYSFMQIISGLILDRFSIRLAATAAIGLLAASLLSFAHYHSFLAMCLSRVAMGIGASFATVLYMKCAAIWTNKKTFAIVSSLLATATMLGAAAGGAPLAYLFHVMDWNRGLDLIAGLSLLLAILSLFFISGKSSDQVHLEKIDKKNLSSVLMNKQNWLLLAYSGLAFSPVVILGGLWGMPFLTLKYGISIQDGSYLLSIMFIGLAVGAPVWSFLALRLNNRKAIMQIANILALLSLLAIIYLNESYETTVILFFILGFCVGCFMLSFQICRDINPFALLGLSFAFMNTGEGIVGSVIEPAIGEILDLLRPVHHAFTISDFHEALLLLPICFVAASMLLIKMDVGYLLGNCKDRLVVTQ